MSDHLISSETSLTASPSLCGFLAAAQDGRDGRDNPTGSYGPELVAANPFISRRISKRVVPPTAPAGGLVAGRHALATSQLIRELKHVDN